MTYDPHTDWPSLDWALPRVIRQAVRAETVEALTGRDDLAGMPGLVIAELQRSAV